MQLGGWVWPFVKALASGASHDFEISSQKKIFIFINLFLQVFFNHG